MNSRRYNTVLASRRPQSAPKQQSRPNFGCGSQPRPSGGNMSAARAAPSQSSMVAPCQSSVPAPRFSINEPGPSGIPRHLLEAVRRETDEPPELDVEEALSAFKGAVESLAAHVERSYYDINNEADLKDEFGLMLIKGAQNARSEFYKLQHRANQDIERLIRQRLDKERLFHKIREEYHNLIGISGVGCSAPRLVLPKIRKLPNEIESGTCSAAGPCATNTTRATVRGDKSKIQKKDDLNLDMYEGIKVDPRKLEGIIKKKTTDFKVKLKTIREPPHRGRDYNLELLELLRRPMKDGKDGIEDKLSCIDFVRHMAKNKKEPRLLAAVQAELEKFDKEVFKRNPNIPTVGNVPQPGPVRKAQRRPLSSGSRGSQGSARRTASRISIGASKTNVARGSTCSAVPTTSGHNLRPSKALSTTEFNDLLNRLKGTLNKTFTANKVKLIQGGLPGIGDCYRKQLMAAINQPANTNPEGISKKLHDLWNGLTYAKMNKDNEMAQQIDIELRRFNEKLQTINARKSGAGSSGRGARKKMQKSKSSAIASVNESMVAAEASRIAAEAVRTIVDATPPAPFMEGATGIPTNTVIAAAVAAATAAIATASPRPGHFPDAIPPIRSQPSCGRNLNFPSTSGISVKGSTGDRQSEYDFTTIRGRMAKLMTSLRVKPKNPSCCEPPNYYDYFVKQLAQPLKPGTTAIENKFELFLNAWNIGKKHKDQRLAQKVTEAMNKFEVDVFKVNPTLTTAGQTAKPPPTKSQTNIPGSRLSTTYAPTGPCGASSSSASMNKRKVLRDRVGIKGEIKVKQWVDAVARLQNLNQEFLAKAAACGDLKWIAFIRQKINEAKKLQNLLEVEIRQHLEQNDLSDAELNLYIGTKIDDLMNEKCVSKDTDQKEAEQCPGARQKKMSASEVQQIWNRKFLSKVKEIEAINTEITQKALSQSKNSSAAKNWYNECKRKGNLFKKLVDDLKKKFSGLMRGTCGTVKWDEVYQDAINKISQKQYICSEADLHRQIQVTNVSNAPFGASNQPTTSKSFAGQGAIPKRVQELRPEPPESEVPPELSALPFLEGLPIEDETGLNVQQRATIDHILRLDTVEGKRINNVDRYIALKSLIEKQLTDLSNVTYKPGENFRIFECRQDIMTKVPKDWIFPTEEQIKNFNDDLCMYNRKYTLEELIKFFPVEMQRVRNPRNPLNAQTFLSICTDGRRVDPSKLEDFHLDENVAEALLWMFYEQNDLPFFFEIRVGKMLSNYIKRSEFIRGYRKLKQIPKERLRYMYNVAFSFFQDGVDRGYGEGFEDGLATAARSGDPAAAASVAVNAADVARDAAEKASEAANAAAEAAEVAAEYRDVVERTLIEAASPPEGDGDDEGGGCQGEDNQPCREPINKSPPPALRKFSCSVPHVSTHSTSRSSAPCVRINDEDEVFLEDESMPEFNEIDEDVEYEQPEPRNRFDEIEINDEENIDDEEFPEQFDDPSCSCGNVEAFNVDNEENIEDQEFPDNLDISTKSTPQEQAREAVLNLSNVVGQLANVDELQAGQVPIRAEDIFNARLALEALEAVVEPVALHGFEPNLDDEEFPQDCTCGSSNAERDLMEFSA